MPLPRCGGQDDAKGAGKRRWASGVFVGYLGLFGWIIVKCSFLALIAVYTVYTVDIFFWPSVCTALHRSAKRRIRLGPALSSMTTMSLQRYTDDTQSITGAASASP